MSIELLRELREKRTNYREMIQFCCDGMILNNDIIAELSKSDSYYFDVFCGLNYDEEEDTYTEVYQYYIINYQDAERLAEYTNELVYYNEALDLYILGVTHWGTSWDYVPSNWKELDEVAKDD